MTLSADREIPQHISPELVVDFDYMNDPLLIEDPHSAYISAKDREAANEDLRGNYEGIGIEFNIVNVMVSTFIFGLGDDYSIFIMDGLQQEYRIGKKNLPSIRTSIFFDQFIGSGLGCSCRKWWKAKSFCLF